MNDYSYKKGQFQIEGVSAESLAEKHGTPLYAYSHSHLVDRYRELAGAMKPIDPLICYSVKANSNGSIINTFVKEGSGFDIVSGGELFRALKAGANPKKIVFAGVGKTEDEITYALREKILFFTVESEQEAERISKCAVAAKTTGRIAFRINPDVDPRTHRYVSTGKKETKFGLDIERTINAYKMASKLPSIEIAGMHMHIGSQILAIEPFVSALGKVLPLCNELRRHYPTFRYLDIGGGIGIKYRPEHTPLSPRAFSNDVVPMLKSSGLSIVMEPGRFLVGNAGVLLARVQYLKNSVSKQFVIIDAAMNDLIRPALYEAYHEILPVRETGSRMRADLVGPVCESGDFIALDRELPMLKSGDLVAIMSAGAYGYSMSSNYNSRPRAAEVMVKGSKAFLIRKRETLKNLVENEILLK